MGFGLVHGLAFATVIGNFQLEPLQKALAIFGFNAGIEIAQLSIVAALMPLMILSAPTRAYGAIRITGAAFAGVAATAWIVERVTNAPNAVAAAVEAIFAIAPWLVAAGTIAALGALGFQWRSARVKPAA
jgi:hypothetical protein